jgi:hypothetical protein
MNRLFPLIHTVIPNKYHSVLPEENLILTILRLFPRQKTAVFVNDKFIPTINRLFPARDAGGNDS